MQPQPKAETLNPATPAPLTVVLGASTNPERYAYKAANQLLANGHAIYLVGIKPGQVQGHTIAPDFLGLKAQVDTITLYVGAEKQPGYYQALLGLKPRRIIFNPGTENPEFEALAQQNGIEALRACTLVMLSTDQY